MNLPSDTVGVVTNLVRVMRVPRKIATRVGSASPSMELEARFGFREEGRFNASVDPTFAQSCLMAMSNYDGWSRIDDWTSDTVFHYRMSDGTGVRTIRSMDGTLTHQIKSSITKADLRLVHADGFSSRLPTHMRISVAEEMPMSPKEIPEKVIPHRVVSRTRKSFHYGSWRYDFTRKVVGTSLSDIEKLSDDPSAGTWEMELECANPKLYLGLNTNDHISRSILLKMLNFFPSSQTGILVE